MLQRRVSPAKRYLRRTLQIIALVGTLIVGIIAIALIVSQTPWFRDWLRRFVVREANQYLNGNLSIGSLSGNLFYGIELGDVAIDVNGQHIVTLKRLDVTYSIKELISGGTTIREIRLEQPFVLLRHDANGWNVANLVKRQQQEADRQGPQRPLSLPDIQIADGRVAIEDRAPSASYTLPSRVDALNMKAGFLYEPVHYSVTLEKLSFAGRSPELTVTGISGRVGTRDDNLNVERLAVKTGQSSVTVDGVIRSYLSNPSLQLTVTSPGMSLPEFAPVLPPLRGFDLHPTLTVKAAGPLDKLDLAIDQQSEAGAIKGLVTADLKTPDLGARGNLDVQHLNLAHLIKDPSQKSDISGHASLNLKLASEPANAPALPRLKGQYALDAPSVVYTVYRASNVHVRGEIDGRRILVDGRAAAYGGTATAKGVFVTAATPAAPFEFNVDGRASHVNLATLPRTLNVPPVTTDLNATAYHVQGEIAKNGTHVNGNATLDPSTLSGGTIVGGTTAQFEMISGPKTRGTAPPAQLTYAAHGGVRDVNLKTVGEAFDIPALAKPEFDGRINADFDLKASGTTLDAMTLDATGTATNSTVFGGTVPRLGFETHLANRRLEGRANGELRGFDPAHLTDNDKYKGTINAAVDASFGIKDLSAPITVDAISADGRVTLSQSDIAGIKIDSADVDGRYVDRRGEIRQATIHGADLEVQASGPIALDDTGNTNVKYHVVATDLTTAAKLADQEIGGSASVDGTLTGNASSLKTTGTLNGSNLSYQSNKALDLNTTFTVTVPNLDFSQPVVQAQTTGTFIEAAGLQINQLKATTNYANKTLEFDTHVAEAPAGKEAEKAAGQPNPGGRELDARGTVIFHPDHQEIHLPNVALRTNGIEWTTAPGSAPAIQYGANRIELQGVRLANGNQQIEANGAFPLNQKGTPGAIDVTAQNIDVSQIEKLLMQNRGFTGTLNANAKITGTTTAQVITGHAEVANGGFQNFKYESLTADATYDDDRVVLDAKLQQSPGVELTAKGTVPLSAVRPNPPGVSGHIEPHAGDELDLRIQSSRIDLGLVQGFTTQLTNVTGTVQADVRVGGSGEDPHFTGYVDVEGGAFKVVPAATSFTGLSTRIELQQDRVVVPQFKILDEHGNALTIEGELAVHQRQAGAVNVSIDSDDFKIIDNQLGNVHVESHLKLTGEVRKPRVEGEIRMDSARLEVDQILLAFATPYSEQSLPDVISADSTLGTEQGADAATRQAFDKGRELSAEAAQRQNAPGPQTPAEEGFFGPLALNVHFIAPDNLVARGRNLRPGGPTAAQIGNVNATVGADMFVQKAPGSAIRLRGTIRTIRGFYEFQGRRFEILRDGTVAFQGLPDINPSLDLTAQRLIPNTGVTATIRITGTMRAPELALTSDPPLDEADILSLIIFNRSINDLGTGERASLTETAAGVASGFIASPLSRSIGKALDVDLFEITTSDPNTGETAGGITLGKQVSDKAFVRFRQQFGQRSFTEFMIEYQLARFLRAQGQVAPETTAAANRLTQRRVERAGLDLIFFFSY